MTTPFTPLQAVGMFIILEMSTAFIPILWFHPCPKYDKKIPDFMALVMTYWTIALWGNFIGRLI